MIVQCERCGREVDYLYGRIGRFVLHASPKEYIEIPICDECRKEISNKILKGIKNESNDAMDER